MEQEQFIPLDLIKGSLWNSLMITWINKHIMKAKMAQQPKHCNNKNKDEDNDLSENNVNIAFRKGLNLCLHLFYFLWVKSPKALASVTLIGQLDGIGRNFVWDMLFDATEACGALTSQQCLMRRVHAYLPLKWAIKILGFCWVWTLAVFIINLYFEMRASAFTFLCFQLMYSLAFETKEK